MQELVYCNQLMVDGPMERLGVHVQDSADRWAPGCVNAAGKARQTWLATAATKLTKPEDRLIADPCK